MIPTDLTITRVDAALLYGTRPRVVGRNARLDVHGNQGRDPIARIHTDTGITGWGWCRASREDGAKLVGRKLCEVFDPARGAVDAFRTVDFPLWDLAGRVLGQPVHALLGGGGVDPVPAYDGSIYFDDLDPETGRDLGLGPVQDAVRMGLERGFRAVKAKLGRGNKWMEKQAGFARDVEVIHAVRELLGDDGTLLVDGNNGFTPAEARELMRQAGDARIHWFEEPFPETLDDCVAFKQFLRDGGWATLVADGEGSCGRADEVLAIARAGGIDVVQFDIRAWTLTGWRRLAPILAEMGAQAAPHNWGSHLSGYYIAQFARACPCFALAEVDTMAMPAVRSDGYALAGGALTVPDAPGFGLDLDADRFADAAKGKGGWAVSTR